MPRRSATPSSWPRIDPRRPVNVASTSSSMLFRNPLALVQLLRLRSIDHTSRNFGSVGTVLSYDYRHLDQDFAAADRLMSPKFRKKYDTTATNGVRPLAVRYKTITTADVSAAGVIDVSASRAIAIFCGLFATSVHNRCSAADSAQKVSNC